MSETLWIVVQGGEICASVYDEGSALVFAKEWVDQYVTDFLRHSLPVKVTPDLVRSFDVRVYRCDTSNEVTLPFQAWVDENYQNRLACAKEDEEHEYKRFVELRSKYEDRFQREALRSLPNCS